MPPVHGQLHAPEGEQLPAMRQGLAIERPGPTVVSFLLHDLLWCTAMTFDPGEMIDIERGPSGLSKGIGQYDVSQSSFADVVDLRRYVEEHLPGAKYGKGRVNPFDVEGRYFSGGYAMMDQIIVKADSTYFGDQSILIKDYGDEAG